MTTTFIPTLAPTLAELVDRLDDAVRAPPPGLDVPHAVGEALRPFLGLPDLLTPEQEVGDADRYRTHLLHVPDDGAYSLVAAVWRPGMEAGDRPVRPAHGQDPSLLRSYSVSTNSRSSCSCRAAWIRRAHPSPPCLEPGASA